MTDSKIVYTHDCEGKLPSREYGAAIEYCVGYEDGTLWVSNTEYASQVAFCPYCGFAANVKPHVTNSGQTTNESESS